MITVNLPEGIKAKDIVCKMKPKHLYLSIKGQNEPIINVFFFYQKK